MGSDILRMEDTSSRKVESHPVSHLPSQSFSLPRIPFVLSTIYYRLLWHNAEERLGSRSE